MRARLVVLVPLLIAATAFAQKPTIVYKAPAANEDDRPVLTEIVISPQGTDYALKLDFNKEPFGDACRNRCANATLFLDTDNNASTGLKLEASKASESGADLAVVIQGTRVMNEGSSRATLRVKVLQYAETATSVEDGSTLAELDPVADSERVLTTGTSVYLLIDANLGNQPAGKQLRVVYHPPDSKPLVGTARGIASPAAGRVELFKDGKLSNPVGSKKKPKPVYPKL